MELGAPRRMTANTSYPWGGFPAGHDGDFRRDEAGGPRPQRSGLEEEPPRRCGGVEAEDSRLNRLAHERDPKFVEARIANLWFPRPAQRGEGQGEGLLHS